MSRRYGAAWLLLGMIKRSSDAETLIIDPNVGRAPMTVRRSQLVRSPRPGTAADNTATAVARCIGRSVRRRVTIAIVITILYPLEYITLHIVQAERIRLE